MNEPALAVLGVLLVVVGCLVLAMTRKRRR